MTKKSQVKLPVKKSKIILLIVVLGIAVLALLYIRSFVSREKPSVVNDTSIAIERLQSKIEQQQFSIESLQNETQQLQAQNSTKAIDWKLIGIENFVKMADLTLNTTGDIKIALAYLRAAKQYADDPKLSSINHALNKDIASLQEAPIVDTEELVLRLRAISQQVAILPVIPQKVSQAPADNAINKNLMQVLKALIVIRHQDIEPLPTPEQAAILRLNIQSGLLEAELAVINKQDKLYHESMSQVSDWIKQCFVLDNASTATILHSLQELQQITLQEKVFSVASSLEAIQEFTSPTIKGQSL